MLGLFMMTVLTIPLILEYSQGKVMDNYYDILRTTFLSIGNLGQA